jgi:adenylosuccinate synthase
MENLQEVKPIKIVIGGQYGSESKGLMVAHLVNEFDADYCVRTGSINAGHTVYFKGKKYVNQLIPVGWVNKKTKLILGSGTYVEIKMLEDEIKMINEAFNDGSDVRERLFIDYRCGLHTDEHMHKEKELNLHGKMGSTGKGVMEAIVSKMKRDLDYKNFGLLEQDKISKYNVADTAVMLNEAYFGKEQIVIEGTQGALLDYHFGHYPYVTSRQTGVCAWLSECGLPHNIFTDIFSVIRTFPIRVAGNSGYMGNEIKWQDLARDLNKKLADTCKEEIVSEDDLKMFEEAESQVMANHNILKHPIHMTAGERVENSQFLSDFHSEVFASLPVDVYERLKKFFEVTTVTKKLRRIAELNLVELNYSNMLNNPNSLVVNFLNYKFPTCAGCKTYEELEACPEWKEIHRYLWDLSKSTKREISYVNCSNDCIIKLRHAYGLEYGI